MLQGLMLPGLMIQFTAGICYATIGVHPCSTKSFEDADNGPSTLLASLKELAIKSKKDGHAVAFGEIGLDYDRLFLSPKETQLKYFEQQLDVAVEVGLPLFLHMRAASEDFMNLLTPRLDKLPKRGLVHSFTGTMEEMKMIVELGFDIGINGCSMKSEDNIQVVKAVPLERIQIETDGPWVSYQVISFYAVLIENSARCAHRTHPQNSWLDRWSCQNQ